MLRWLSFRSIGKTLFECGLNNSHSGNISIRKRDSIFISATGAMLHKINAAQVVRVGMTTDPKRDERASMEFIVHRAIYKTHPEVNAIIHAHCPYSVAMADKKSEIIPHDDEGTHYFKSIPVLSVENSISSTAVAYQLPLFLKDSPVVIVDRHGVFATGKTLEEALKYLTVVESLCRLNYLVETRCPELKNRAS
jgi:L-fuculose-phosphate aldolase